MTTVARLERQSFSPCRPITVAQLAAALSDDPAAYLWIEVRDQGGQWIEGLRSDLGRRCLEIVEALADYWDVRGDEAGRVVRGDS